MTLAERLYSVEDLLNMEEGDAYELDDGVLKELPVGFESEEVAVISSPRCACFSVRGISAE